MQVDPSNLTIDFHLSDQSKIKKYYVFVGDYPVGFSVISLNIRKNVILSLAFESIFPTVSMQVVQTQINLIYRDFK